MSARDRNPPETPEAVALALFMEIRRLEENDEQARGSNELVRARLLDLYAECLMAAHGNRHCDAEGAMLH